MTASSSPEPTASVAGLARSKGLTTGSPRARQPLALLGSRWLASLVLSPLVLSPLVLSSLGALAVTGLGACSEPYPVSTLLLISIDTARADFVDPTDAETMPNLAALAERGTAFTNVTSGTSWTLPSHAQMFTGQPPALHGVQDDNLAIDGQTPTLPELLSMRGWDSFGVYSGPYLFSDFGFGRGFDLYQNALPDGEQMELAFRSAASTGDVQQQVGAWRGAEVQSHQAITSAEVTDRAIASLQYVDERDDVFLFAHYFDAHYDYVPPAPFDTRFDPDYTGDIDGADFFLNPRIRDRQTGERRISERDLDHIKALYRGEIAWVDQEIGRLLDELRSMRRLDDAYIIVTGDHGEEFFEHGSVGHRNTLFEEQLRVPLLIVPPKLSALAASAPRTSDVTASLSDILPTAMSAFSGPIPATVAGRSLLPVLEGGSLAPRGRLSSLRFRPLAGKDAAGNPTALKHRFLQTFLTADGNKLTRYFRVQGDDRKLTGAAFVDLAADPGELSPITADDPRLIAAWEELEAELLRLRTIYDELPHDAPEDRVSAARNMFAGQLEALGYLAGTDGELPTEGGDIPDTLPWGLAPLPAWSLEAARR